MKFLLEISKDYKFQQEIAQRIIGEQESSLIVNMFVKTIKLSNLTPRLFWKNGCNVVLIKISSYLVGVSSSAIEYMIPNKSKIILVKDDIKILNVRKHVIRNNFAQKINGAYVLF